MICLDERVSPPELETVKADELATPPVWPVYVISLRGAAERRAGCTEAMRQLGLRFEFFDAVEGAKLNEEELARAYDPDKNAWCYKHPLSRPEIGCWLSHYALWRRIAEDKAGGAFLLEDDFKAEPGLAEAMRAISRANLKNCMVKLHAHRGMRGEVVGSLPCGHRLILPRRVPGMTLGYAVDKGSAARLTAGALPMSRPVDMEIKHWWEADVPVLVVQPNLLRVDRRQTGSTIDAARAEAQMSGLRRTWCNLRYQLAYNIGVLRHRRRQRQHAARLRSAMMKARER